MVGATRLAITTVLDAAQQRQELLASIPSPETRRAADDLSKAIYRVRMLNNKLDHVFEMLVGDGQEVASSIANHNLKRRHEEEAGKAVYVCQCGRRKLLGTTIPPRVFCDSCGESHSLELVTK